MKGKRWMEPVIGGVGFLSAFGFFLLAYPYHLMRREQMTLFLFDGDYIRQTYRGSGWLARFVCDFLDQFFHLPVVGPLVVALLLTAIGVVTYRIVRRFLGEWPSLAVAALVFAWSFLRETENLYSTRYTLVVLGYLALLLLARALQLFMPGKPQVWLRWPCWPVSASGPWGHRSNGITARRGECRRSGMTA